MWKEGKIELLKYLGFGNEDDAICLYFPDSMKLPYMQHLTHIIFFSASNFPELKQVLRN